MSRRRPLALLCMAALMASGATLAQCPAGGPALQRALVQTPGHVEPHTPGSGAGEEFATPQKVTALLGPSPDLNRVSYLRTWLPKPSAAPPRAVLILMPGFLGGATSFEPLARELVRAMNGQLEVWAIDRRANQLEDRLGALHARAGTEQAIQEGAQFYFEDYDGDPEGDFPGPGDLDIDQDGNLDTTLELTDGFGATRGFLRMEQDDMRYAAYWGVDTVVRDWKILVDQARAKVGPDGLVLVGGHSLGTLWAALFAAYDFDPGPGVDAARDHIDGVLLIEGGGAGPGVATKPTKSEYLASVEALATPGGPPVFLFDVQGIPVADLGASAEIAGIAGTLFPTQPSIAQRTPIFGVSILGSFFQAPLTNRAVVGIFIDDDFQPLTAFRASVGFSDDGQNNFLPPAPLAGFPDSFYVALPAAGGAVRGWKDYDDPTLPSCPPNVKNVSPGCARIDNGARPSPTATPRIWGQEREVSDLDDLMRIQFETGNFIEWYFVSGRTGLDFQFGRDSISLGDESLLAVTQNAGMDKPVLCIGGSNGLTPSEASFAGYLGSIATPPADKEIVILEGYAHLDPVVALDNEAVPAVTGWVSRLLQRKLLATF